LKRSQRKHTLNANDENSQKAMKQILNGYHTKNIAKKHQRKHHRKRSKDDLDLSFKPRNLTGLDVLNRHGIIMGFSEQNYQKSVCPITRRFDANDIAIHPVSELHETGSVIVHPSTHNTPIVMDAEFKDDEIIEMDSDDSTESSTESMNEEDVQMRLTSFQNREKPRLSFIPTLMPEMELSMTSPTSGHSGNSYGLSKSIPQKISPDESYMTPNGGAAVTVSPTKNNKFGRNGIPNFATMDPSKLFGIVSEYTDTVSTNGQKRMNGLQSPWTGASQRCNNGFPSKPPSPPSTTKSIKKRNQRKRKSGAYSGASGPPLYVTHKKRKSKAKRNGSRSKELNVGCAHIEQVQSW